MTPGAGAPGPGVQGALPLGMGAGGSLDSVAHVIQTALTPVFMLSGIGTLLNLFNTRLARVSDHLTEVNGLLEDGGEGVGAAAAARLRHYRARLRRRLLMLDAAILFGAVGGAATCGAALALFVGSVRDATAGAWLVDLFGAALGCTVAALAAFLADSLLAWHALRNEKPLPRKLAEG